MEMPSGGCQVQSVSRASMQLMDLSDRLGELQAEGTRPIPIYVGYDHREAVAYHIFAHSILRRATRPVAIIPIALHLLGGFCELRGDGSNAFTYSRFLVPWLQGYQGWAIFADGDMVCLDDIVKLWDQRDDRYAVMVAKHDYKTRFPFKYLAACRT
jgi:hypothetical protein